MVQIGLPDHSVQRKLKMSSKSHDFLLQLPYIKVVPEGSKASD